MKLLNEITFENTLDARLEVMDFDRKIKIMEDPLPERTQNEDESTSRRMLRLYNERTKVKSNRLSVGSGYPRPGIKPG